MIHRLIIRRVPPCAMVVALMCASEALGLTITFNETVPEPDTLHAWVDNGITFHDEAGWRFTPNANNEVWYAANDAAPSVTNVDGDFFYMQLQSSNFTITRPDSEPFTFSSFRVGDPFGSDGTLDVLGSLAAGGTVNASYSFENTSTTSNNLVQKNLPVGFSDPLTSVTMTRTSGSFVGYDDFNLAIVAEPSTFKLAAAGLGFCVALGCWWRRRRRAQCRRNTC